MSTDLTFPCRVCGMRHEPCIDMMQELRLAKIRATQVLGPAARDKSLVELIDMLSDPTYMATLRAQARSYMNVD